MRTAPATTSRMTDEGGIFSAQLLQEVSKLELRNRELSLQHQELLRESRDSIAAIESQVPVFKHEGVDHCIWMDFACIDANI